MSIKIGICNFKGGVGKTVVAMNLGYILSRKPAKVILIDLDPQMNSITGFGISKKEILNERYVNLTMHLQLGIEINVECDKYDYIIFDVPPKDLDVTGEIIRICDKLIIPVIPDFFSLEGLAQILNFIKVKQSEYGVKNTYNILINQYEGNNISSDICNDINKHFGEMVFFTIIPKDDNIRLAINACKAVVEYNALCASSIAMIMLSKEVINGRGRIW